MKKTLFSLTIFAAFLIGFSACNPNAILHKPNQLLMINTMETPSAASGVFNIPVKTIDGVSTNLEAYKGKKIIILNVASECGYTPQYAKWQAFYEANKDKAVVLGFPANNFGGQEPGTNADVKTFCTKNYGVTFPMFEKVSVKGTDKSALYQWLTDPKQNGWNSQEPSWNFCKYLVNEKGELTEFFASAVEPSSDQFMKAFNK